MSLQFIIDGCNVSHHPKFIKIIPKKHSDSRVSLIKLIRLRKLCGSENNSVWVVFDGYPDQSLVNLGKNNLEIIFSYNQTADEKIKRFLELSDNPKNTVIVSDDKEISSFARLMHAKVVSVELFIKEKEIARLRVAASDELKVNYSQMQKINDELRKLWLK